jgi:hypothetical protein
MGESKEILILQEMSKDEDLEDDGPIQIPCSKCGNPTTFDPIYEDLCYRCIRADNE